MPRLLMKYAIAAFVAFVVVLTAIADGSPHWLTATVTAAVTGTVLAASDLLRRP